DALEGFGTSATISTPCAAALNASIACDVRLRAMAASRLYVSPASPETLCTPACNSSLAMYRSNVATACGKSPLFDFNLSNSWKGDLLQTYFNLVCSEDPDSGALYFLQQQYEAVGNVTDITQLPPRILCSSCQASYFENMQSSPFLGYNALLAIQWQSIQKTCGLSLPLDVDPGSALSVPNQSNATTASNECASGKIYTVQQSDTCQSVATVASVSQGTLWAINNLEPNCSAMAAGQSLCLPQSCQTYTMSATDDCWNTAKDFGLDFATFLSYNPAINPECGNLNTTGPVVCVSNPNGDYIPTFPPASTVPSSAGEYADFIVDPPGPTPFNTTSQCGGYYQVQVADTCERISLAAKVGVELFELINPSIDANCFNLVPDLWYCVHPLRGWNDTDTDDGSGGASSVATVAAPAPTPPGSSNSCFQWHIIVSGDSCFFLQNTLGVSMAELVFWNPDLHADCGNLILGDAYCITGPPLPATSTSTTAIASSPINSASRLTASSTTAGPTSTCQKAYTVKSGDTCFAIWTEFGLTEAQFRALNPNLDANCDLNIGDVLCVATCKKTYTVKSGDTCFAIWTEFGLTEAQLRALNPTLDAGCDIDVGQALCV
ncbi:hypothetical protein GQ53DRAFT_589993, partial [Thozetella sp. PMI_491]